jgi:hypothetical protein
MNQPKERWMWYVAMSSLAALLAASAARAQPQPNRSATGQPPADLLMALQQKTSLGDTLRVVMNDITQRKGILAEVSATSVTLIVKGKREVLIAAALRRVVRENPDSLRNGARNGATVGAAIIATLLLPSPRQVVEPMALTAIGICVGLGAAIGTGIDALIHNHTVVYDRAAAPRASLTVAPLLAPHQAGARVAVIW